MSGMQLPHLGRSSRPYAPWTARTSPRTRVTDGSRGLLDPDLIEEHAIEGVELHVVRARGRHEDVATCSERDHGRCLRDLALNPLPRGAPLGVCGLRSINRGVDRRIAEGGEVEVPVTAGQGPQEQRRVRRIGDPPVQTDLRVCAWTLCRHELLTQVLEDADAG